MVPFWVPIIIRPLIFRVPLGYPKRDHNFDNQPYINVFQRVLGANPASLQSSASHLGKSKPQRAQIQRGQRPVAVIES